MYDMFVERLRERVEQLTVGDPAREQLHGPGGQQGGPGFHAGLYRGRQGGRQVGRREGTRRRDAEGGYFLEPTVFADISPDADLPRRRSSGPVLAVIKVTALKKALKVANNTEYGLTGAIYTNDRERLKCARREFHVGNLYLNRKCTGAMVGAHPFGGFNMSGTDSKAGGPDYLYLFTQAKSVAEKFTGNSRRPGSRVPMRRQRAPPVAALRLRAWCPSRRRPGRGRDGGS